jgi:hypothetical protein
MRCSAVEASSALGRASVCDAEGSPFTAVAQVRQSPGPTSCLRSGLPPPAEPGVHREDKPSQDPTFEGRPLDRPEEELTDQGLRLDVVTVLSRRNLLRTFGLGATASTLAACGADASSSGSASSAASAASGEIPDETAGPYPGDGWNGPDALEQSGIVRSDIRSSFGEASGTGGWRPSTPPDAARTCTAPGRRTGRSWVAAPGGPGGAVQEW